MAPPFFINIYKICKLMARDTVILLHGLARSSSSMLPVEKFLKSHDYSVVNISYPSRKKTIEELVLLHLKPALEKLDDKEGKVHFVTHSMGGILLRTYLEKNKISNLGRVVMLCPPNRGSEVVDKFGGLKIFKLINGPAGLQLSTDSNSLPNRLQQAHFELGIIMGDKSYNPFLNWVFKEENDGKVSVSRSKLKGMKDFLLLPYTHTFIMNKKETLIAVLNFIQTGHFKPQTTTL